YRVWYGMFDRVAASQLAAVLLLFFAALLRMERVSRGRRRLVPRPRHGPVAAPVALRGVRALGALAACGSVLGLAFVLPVGQLTVWAVQALRAGRVTPAFPALLANTLALAAAAAFAACAVAVTLAYAVRLHSARANRAASRLALRRAHVWTPVTQRSRM